MTRSLGLPTKAPTPSSESVACAYPNIALVKYWGKANSELHIPTTSSISMTLDICPTSTSVSLNQLNDVGRDEVYLDDQPAPAEFASRVNRFLDLVRERANDNRPAIVRTVNQIPTGAGLASSAAGFAALAVAAVDAYGMHLTRDELTRLARRGSGSASRSIIDQYALWHRVESNQDTDASFAEKLTWSELDMAMVLVGVDTGVKSVSSREAMDRTMRTSPFYWPWVNQSHDDVREMLVAGQQGDLDKVGTIAERNALGMHATMLGAQPAIRYATAGTLRVLDHVQQLRIRGLQAYVTMDAGPNVKIICAAGQRHTIADCIRERWPQYLCLTAMPGDGATLITSKGIHR